MDYLSSLHCKTEPFVAPSGSEIYICQGTRESTEKISHNISLGAGLQLVIGAAGSGKTTLLNELAQKFCANNKTVVLLISKPQFRDLQQFLITIAGISKPSRLLLFLMMIHSRRHSIVFSTNFVCRRKKPFCCSLIMARIFLNSACMPWIHFIPITPTAGVFFRLS